MRVDYRHGKRWCGNCGEQVEPEGVTCPFCGHRVRQAPRRSDLRELFRGLVGRYSMPKPGPKAASVKGRASRL